jgi:hypothetical protein
MHKHLETRKPWREPKPPQPPPFTGPAMLLKLRLIHSTFRGKNVIMDSQYGLITFIKGKAEFRVPVDKADVFKNECPNGAWFVVDEAIGEGSENVAVEAVVEEEYLAYGELQKKGLKVSHKQLAEWVKDGKIKTRKTSRGNADIPLYCASDVITQMAMAAEPEPEKKEATDETT